MEAIPFTAYLVGSVCSLYCIAHVVASLTNPRYEPPDYLQPTNDRHTPIFMWVRMIAAFVGFVVLGTQVARPLFWLLPTDWGIEIEGEWQSYRERFTQLTGFLLGLPGLYILNHRSRLQRADRRVEASEKQMESIQRYRETRAQSEIPDPTKQRERAAKTIRDTDRKMAPASSGVDPSIEFLRQMTDAELDAVWEERPLISWTEPMHSMSFEEQKAYWKRNLDIHSWDISAELCEKIRARIAKQ